MLRIIFVLCGCFILVGCAGTFNDPIMQSEINNLPFKKYNEDYSTGANQGILYIISQPSSTDMVSDEYHFLVASQKFDAYKNSLAKFTLDAGEYTIQGEDDFFSHLISIKTVVDGAAPVCVTYRGPSDMTEPGSFSQVPCTNDNIKYAFSRASS